MKKVYAFFLMLIICIPAQGWTDMLGNPGTQVGEKNLFVGIEYSSALKVYDIDTRDIETTSERATLKITTGLSDWFDFFVKVGGVNLTMNYKEAEYVYKTSGGTENWGNATKNFESDYTAGFGAGTRIRLLNFVNSDTRVYFQGGGFFLKAKDNIQWEISRGSINKERDIKLFDLYAGLGIAKKMDYIDLPFGVGLSEVWWELDDVNSESTGSSTIRTHIPKRDSFESKNPFFGFIGLDFILPNEYRISLQAGMRNIDEGEFSVAISQGLPKD